MKNSTRYFMNSDGDIIIVEYATKKAMIEAMKDSNNSRYTDCYGRSVNGFEDNIFEAVVVTTGETIYISEEAEQAEAKTMIYKVERTANVNIVNCNPYSFMVYGAIDINEYGVVTPSETIADNIDSSISEITEAEAEEIFEAERTAAEVRRIAEEQKRQKAIEAVVEVMNSNSYTEEEAEEAAEQLLIKFGYNRKNRFFGTMLSEVMKAYAEQVEEEKAEASEEEAAEMTEEEKAEAFAKNPILESYYNRQCAIANMLINEIEAEAEQAEEEAETMTAAEIAEAKEAIENHRFYNNFCTIKTVKKHYEQIENKSAFQKRVINVCNMIIAEEAEQKKQKKAEQAKAEATAITAVYDFSVNTVSYTIDYTTGNSRSYNSKTKAAEQFINNAKAFTAEIYKYNSDSIVKMYITYYSTAEEAEQAEEAFEEAKAEAIQKAKRNNDSAINWNNYSFVGDSFYSVTVSKQETAEEAAERFIKCKQEQAKQAKQRKQEQEQRKQAITEAEEAAEEIAEAIEATEDAEILIGISEQAKEAAEALNLGGFYTTAIRFVKLAEQAKEKATKKATGILFEILETETAAAEAEILRTEAEAAAEAEVVEAIEQEQQKLLNRLNDLKTKQAEAAEQETATAEAEQKPLKINMQFFANSNSDGGRTGNRTAAAEVIVDIIAIILCVLFAVGTCYAIGVYMTATAEAEAAEAAAEAAEQKKHEQYINYINSLDYFEAAEAVEEAAEQEQRQKTAEEIKILTAKLSVLNSDIIEHNNKCIAISDKLIERLETETAIFETMTAAAEQEQETEKY